MQTINYCPWLLHTHKAFNSYCSLVQFFKIQVSPVYLPYHCRYISTSNLEHLEHFDPNGIIVHPGKLLIIVHGCYTLRRPLIAIVALVQIFKIQVAPVHFPYHCRNISTSNLEHSEHFDPNGIMVHPCKLLIIVHGTPLQTINNCPWLLHTQKAFNSYCSSSTVF